jgi:hypothetical protein
MVDGAPRLTSCEIEGASTSLFISDYTIYPNGLYERRRTMADNSTMRPGSDAFGSDGEARLSRRAWLLGFAAAAGAWLCITRAYAHGSACFLIAEDGLLLANESDEALEG